ncbi:rCG60275, isoform CRA_a [Rattus norvegicus]|uniref:RCG60275, isoform CRA_a n=1 Tax=Rattus norvegicus TaxID=10116 RepID=A6HRS6_RAT|nr:rCG60275, isoform CRA_a [Rattus norvegicus]
MNSGGGRPRLFKLPPGTRVGGGGPKARGSSVFRSANKWPGGPSLYPQIPNCQN